MQITKVTNSDKVFNFLNYTFLSIAFLLVFYPLYFILIASFSEPTEVINGNVWIIPKMFNFEGYERIFQDRSIMKGYYNSIKYTSIGTAINLICTLPAAYALSRKDLHGRKFLMFMIVFTMFFKGGLIPTFLVVRNLQLYNTMWAIILLVAVMPWYLIIARTFFLNTIPDELHDAAQIDGCCDIHFFMRIVLPLSSTIIAIMILFYGVQHWNSFFSAMIYLNDKELYPLQLVLRNILIINRNSNMIDNIEELHRQQTIALLIQYGVIVVAALPLLIMYPFLQRYFIKGIMVGALKG